MCDIFYEPTRQNTTATPQRGDCGVLGVERFELSATMSVACSSDSAHAAGSLYVLHGTLSESSAPSPL